MLTIQAVNVNDAYDKAVIAMSKFGVPEESRNGDVTAAPFPVMTVYERPTQRVLFNRHRDANPFFHFFECLWMISGSDDGKWLDRFVSDFSSRYAEPESGHIWGAYGYRWRNWFGYDQIGSVVTRLRANPKDRRVVIQMLDGAMDMCSEDYTLSGEIARDIPCNTAIYPRIVDGALDITVTCRSNDVVWGAYGANAVHFSFLQEYMAGMIGVRVGKYYQLSNNWHLYESVCPKFAQDPLAAYPTTFPIGENWSDWDADLFKFMTHPERPNSYSNSWFLYVARQMWLAHYEWKFGSRVTALRVAEGISALDWRRAVLEWMHRRLA